MLGVNTNRRIPCAEKPDTHGWHPENEPCPYCPTMRMVEPEKTEDLTGPEYWARVVGAGLWP